MDKVYIGVMVLSAFLSAVSQLLLKKSAQREYKSKIFEYLNVRVILGYGLLMSTLLLNVWAYRGVDYKIGPVINASSYIFVMLLGRFVLAEKLTAQKIIGVCLIVLGIVVSTVF